MIYELISADSHVNEPPDTFIDRVPNKFRDRAPHMESFPKGDAWILEGSPNPVTFGRNACAGMSVWANALVLKINESAHSLSLEAVNGLLQESEKRQLQVLNAGYVVAAARCSTCLFVSFVALHNHFKTRRFSYDEVWGEDCI